MPPLTKTQLRRYLLSVHHLSAPCTFADIGRVVGACGMQNSPPGAWETALHQRIPSCTLADARRALEQDKLLLQTFSLRGAPYVFPTAQSDVFLSALIPQHGEPWLYTRGIELALTHLQMSLDPLLELLCQVMPRLDGQTIQSKVLLDQTLAEWMLPLLPPEKQALWLAPSMYGDPERQCVGGAVVSFLLRPCALLGLLVFGKREGLHPTFSTYTHWVGKPLTPAPNAAQRLVRKFLHCYGPGTPTGLAQWLGCSPAQAQRLWGAVRDELEPAAYPGSQRYILCEDRALLADPPPPAKPLLLLGAHDPYLSHADRALLLPDTQRQRRVFTTVSNPGVILLDGEIVGQWRPRQTAKSLSAAITLFNAALPKPAIEHELEAYAHFRQRRLACVTYEE